MGAQNSTSQNGRDDAAVKDTQGIFSDWWPQEHLIYNATSKDVIVIAFGRRRTRLVYQIPFMTSRRISAVRIFKLKYLNDGTPALLDVPWQFDIVVYSEPLAAAPQYSRYEAAKHKDVVQRVVDAECDVSLLVKMEQMLARTNEKKVADNKCSVTRGSHEDTYVNGTETTRSTSRPHGHDNTASMYASVHPIPFVSRTTDTRVGDHYDALAASKIRCVVDSNRGAENGNHGFVFEEQQACTFNSCAIRTGAKVRAVVVHGTGPTDIRVTMGNTILHNVQLKAYKTPAATKRAVNKSKERYPENDLFVVPKGHQVKEHSLDALDVAGIRSEPITREELAELRDNCTANERALRSSVARQDRRIVAHASILGLVIGGATAIVAEIPRAQRRLQGLRALERLVARRLIPHSLSLANGDERVLENGRWRYIVATVVAFAFGEDVSWRHVVSHVTAPATKGASIGLSTGYVLSKTGVYITRHVAALEATHDTSNALPMMRAIGSNLGFMLLGTTVACDIGSILWSSHGVHRRAVGRVVVGAMLRGTVSLATTAVASRTAYSGRVAVISGMAYALTEAFFGLSTRCANWLLPFTNEERDFNAAQCRKHALSQALTLLKLNWAGLFDPTTEYLNGEQRTVEATKRVKHHMRQWVRALHSERNDGRQHVMFHTILAACAIVLAEIQQNPVEVHELLELADIS